MSKRSDQPPQPGRQLFENLFVRRNRDATLEVLSKGLSAVLANATRLIEDVKLPVDAERYASARFLLATADEEMAKSYILLDACRLDFSRHESTLRRLCQAFYDHVAKHTYNQIVRFDSFRNMNHVKAVWDAWVIRWRPSPAESGEPDMPHFVYFERELPLYVDFIDYDQEWSTPKPDTSKHRFEESLGTNDLAESRGALDRLRTTSKAGLYKPECLTILNDTFKDHYITEGTNTDLIDRLYKRAANRIESDIGIPEDDFWESALFEWPLYHLVTEHL